jgi:signal transduction histidine kinase
MKNLKHIRLAAILMTLSWLLLFAFVAQWLVARYGAEKEILRRELDRQFAETRMQVMDSTLVINLIDPMIRDQERLSVVMTTTDSGIVYHDRLDDKVIAGDTGTGRKNLVYRIHLSDSMKTQDFPSDNLARFTADSGNVVLHSIRLMVGKAIDSDGNRAIFKQLLPSDIDTALFRNIFNQKIKGEGREFEIRWYSDTGPMAATWQGRNAEILLSGKVFNGSVEASIGRFSWYLIRKMIPQILFVTALLLITAIAFVFTFRSLKKQMMLNELRNDFISNISHELKTPVATVKVALESLRTFDMKRDPAVAGEYLTMASKEMERLDQLITRVLNIPVLEENGRMLTIRTADLAMLTERVIRSIAARLEAASAELSFDAPGVPVLCPVDELYVEGVLLNLIDNSLKYSTGNPRITIHIREEDRRVLLTLSDQGPGIPEQYLHKVFEKFFRVPTGDRHNVKGHGLGLSYAAQVMKQHGGTIGVRNLGEGGCIFTLSFPKK